MSTPSAPPETRVDPAVRSRRRLRRWLLLGFSPVAVASLLVVVKLLSMYALAHQAITAHVERNATGTVAAAKGLLPANWFEPHLAPYDYGVGLASAGDLGAARAQFEAALPLATGYDACPIHINLGLVVEMMADQAEDAAEKKKLYAEALDINTATPSECRTPEANEQSPDPERPNEDTLDEQQERLQQKQQGEPQGGEGDEDEPQGGGEEQSDEEKQEQQDKLDDIEEKLQQGEQEREKQGANGEDDGGSGGTDKPW